MKLSLSTRVLAIPAKHPLAADEAFASREHLTFHPAKAYVRHKRDYSRTARVDVYKQKVLSNSCTSVNGGLNAASRVALAIGGWPRRLGSLYESMDEKS
jgi:hypothetical protein